MNKPINVFWFRRDLRLDDNIGLHHALCGELPVLAIFIFDVDILNSLTNKRDRRVDFIHRSLQLLKVELEKLGSSLLVLHNSTNAAFSLVLEKYNVKAVFTNRDYEPYAISRDALIERFLAVQAIKFYSFKDQVFFEKNEVVKPDGSPYTVFTPYSKIWKRKFASEENLILESGALVKKFIQLKPLPLLSLADIGFEKTDLVIPSPIAKQSILEHYNETRNLPALKGTSQLSIHLRFGTISIRKLARISALINEQFLNELIWRDFFMCILFHFPNTVTISFKKQHEKIKWLNSETDFTMWCQGKTGYPLVDAGMRELNETGWMHNRVRMVVASFLTKHLLIDWRWGEAYFAEKLNDYDLAANIGNWQWAASCGCDAVPYFRIFNPSEQTKRFDPEFIYIKKWVKDFQELSYARPMVEHTFARNRALKTFKEALQKN